MLIDDIIKYMLIIEKINKLSSRFILFRILLSLFHSLFFYKFLALKIRRWFGKTSKNTINISLINLNESKQDPYKIELVLNGDASLFLCLFL
jgi:hypothetical protein